MSVRSGYGETSKPCAAFEIARDVQRRARPAHGVDDQIILAGVTRQQLPDDPTRRGSDVIAIALLHGCSRNVVLAGIFPQCRGEDAEVGLTGWSIHGWEVGRDYGRLRLSRVNKQAKPQAARVQKQARRSHCVIAGRFDLC